MKLFCITTLCLLSCVASSAQVKKHAVKALLENPLLTTNADSVSYAIGLNQIRPMKVMHIEFNINAIDDGVTDSLILHKSRLTALEVKKLQDKLKQSSHIDSSSISGMNPSVQLSGFNDSLSYAYGLDIAHSLITDYGVKTVDLVKFNHAIAAGLTNKLLLLTILQARKVLSNIYRPAYLANLQASNKFIAENRHKPGVITLPDGLQYMVLKAGTGPNITMKDSVSAHYKGTLANGTQFDSSYDRGQPLKLADITRVISGWTEGLQLMNLGAKYRFFIPPGLAYGSRQRSDVIVPYSALIFDVEVVKIGDRLM